MGGGVSVTGPPGENPDIGGRPGGDAYVRALLLTTGCAFVLFLLFALGFGLIVPNGLPAVPLIAAMGMFLGFPLWLFVTLICSAISLPLTAFFVRQVRLRRIGRPFWEIGYGVVLGAAWGWLVKFVPWFGLFGDFAIAIGGATGALWAFWFWRFDRQATASEKRTQS
jgi:hypothetical protein